MAQGLGATSPVFGFVVGDSGVSEGSGGVSSIAARIGVGGVYVEVAGGVSVGVWLGSIVGVGEEGRGVIGMPLGGKPIAVGLGGMNGSGWAGMRGQATASATRAENTSTQATTKT